MQCCPESLNEYAAGNSASDPPQRTQTVIGLNAFCKTGVLNAVTYVALRYEGNRHNAGFFTVPRHFGRLVACRTTVITLDRSLRQAQ